MKTDITTVSSCRVKIAVEADATEIKSAVASVKAAFTRDAKISGFRPGKAPWEKILRSYGKEYTEELNQQVLKFVFNKAITETKVNYCELVDVEDLKVSESTGATCTLVVDLNPKVDDIDLSKISIKKADPQVSDEDVESRLSYFRGMLASFTDATEDDVAGENDLVSVSVASDIDPESVAPEARRWVKDDEYWAQMRDEAFIPKMSEALVGKKSGDVVAHTATYPADFHLSDLAEKTIAYTLTVKTIRKHAPATDEVLIQRFGLESIEKLREMLKEDMLKNITAEEENRVQQEIGDALIAATSFDCPESAVSAVANDEIQRMLSAQKVTEKEIEENRDAILQTAKIMAERRVRLRHIAQKIAVDKGMILSNEELNESIDRLAASMNLKSQEVVKRIIDNGRMDEFMVDELSTKVMKYLATELAK